MRNFVTAPLVPVTVPSGAIPPWYFDCWQRINWQNQPELIANRDKVTLGIVASLVNIDPSVRSLGLLFCEILTGGSTGNQGASYVGNDAALPIPTRTSTTFRSTDIYPHDSTTIGGLPYPRWSQLLSDEKTIDIDTADINDPRGDLWCHVGIQVLGVTPNITVCSVEFQVINET